MAPVTKILAVAGPPRWHGRPSTRLKIFSVGIIAARFKVRMKKKIVHSRPMIAVRLLAQDRAGHLVPQEDAHGFDEVLNPAGHELGRVNPQRDAHQKKHRHGDDHGGVVADDHVPMPREQRHRRDRLQRVQFCQR